MTRKAVRKLEALDYLVLAVLAEIELIAVLLAVRY